MTRKVATKKVTGNEEVPIYSASGRKVKVGDKLYQSNIYGDYRYRESTKRTIDEYIVTQIQYDFRRYRIRSKKGCENVVHAENCPKPPYYHTKSEAKKEVEQEFKKDEKYLNRELKKVQAFIADMKIKKAELKKI